MRLLCVVHLLIPIWYSLRCCGSCHLMFRTRPLQKAEPRPAKVSVSKVGTIEGVEMPTESAQISELVQLMKDRQRGIHLRTHKYKKAQFPKSFRGNINTLWTQVLLIHIFNKLGSECVDWMLSALGFRTRSSAIYMAETLMNRFTKD